MKAIDLRKNRSTKVDDPKRFTKGKTIITGYHVCEKNHKTRKQTFVLMRNRCIVCVAEQRI